MKNKICAIIPAAGRGKRLGSDIPKILMPICGDKTVWDILYKKLYKYVDRIHVVLSPLGVGLFEKQLKKESIGSNVTISVQKEPIGMGDAIFGASDYWKDCRHILIVWSDQVFVSTKTIDRTIKSQTTVKDNGLTIPTSISDQPYVQYVFNHDLTKLIEIRQSREGDVCERNGFTDVGVFCVSTVNLKDAWMDYVKKAPRGDKTGEINFLPFMPYLSTELGWGIKTVMVEDPLESRGINTLEDLIFFKNKFASLVK